MENGMKLSEKVKGWFFPYNEWSNISNRDNLIKEVKILEQRIEELEEEKVKYNK